jgi:hypothetical protein
MVRSRRSSTSSKQQIKDNIYAVEKIIDKRSRKGKKEYLIKWKDYDLYRFNF